MMRLPKKAVIVADGSVIGSIVFAENPIRPFVDHVCRDSLLSSGSAAGSGRFSSNLFEINTCNFCGMGFTHPIPTEETAHLLYETRESRDFQPDDSSLMTWLKAIVARRDVRSFLGEFERPEGPVLDYGCGNAAFTIALQEAFPNLQVIGTDMQKESPNALPQSQYRSYVELAEMSGKCSIILCRHVLEHSYDPVKLLTKLSDLLMPGGVLVVEVPSLETKAKRLFGKYWAGYYVPFHPIHFTREALRRAFLAANFSIIREGAAEMPNMGRSIQNFLGCKYNLGIFVLGMLLHAVQIGIGLTSDTSVCLRIWGRKTVG
jgi:SAM-dependent methyltransferase